MVNSQTLSNVTVRVIERLDNSVSGNARYRLHCHCNSSDCHPDCKMRWLTKIDSAVIGQVANMIDHLPMNVTLTIARNRVVGISDARSPYPHSDGTFQTYSL